MNKFTLLLTLSVLFLSARADIDPGAKAGLIIGGILKGALDAEMVNLDMCIYDAEKFALDIYHAVLDFEKKSFDGVAQGIKKIGIAVE